MKVIAGVDGSKYARWAIEWIAQFSFDSSPQMTALHAVDVVSLRAPFINQLGPVSTNASPRRSTRN